MKAMILAAGLGTRLKPLTDKIPKALIKVNGITMLEHVIIRLKKFGINEIIINVFHLAEQIEAFLKTKNNFDIRIELSFEDTLLDTGGGLKKASWFFDKESSFLLHNVDVISDLNITEMQKIHNNNDSMISIAIRSRKTSRYFLFDKNNRLCGWKNENTGEQKIVKESSQDLLPFSFMGIHVISPNVFKYFPEENKLSIVDLYLDNASENKILGFQADKYSWIDCGKQENLAKAEYIIYHKEH